VHAQKWPRGTTNQFQRLAERPTILHNAAALVIPLDVLSWKERLYYWRMARLRDIVATGCCRGQKDVIWHNQALQVRLGMILE
jgi:hypothetical protein